MKIRRGIILRNHFRRKYIKARKEMKIELKALMKDNVTLMMLIRDIYIAYSQRRLIHKIWYELGTKHHDIYQKEFCGENGLVGKMLCGRYDEFFTTMYSINKDFYKKYVRRIPDKVALGDAYAVAINYMKQLEV
ncbi:hypothetical protein IAI10_16685 [Clostridium sp. 19966]|uniref:hypothetical protein n=1 Tax=Clostridium sp. 19966 TaxID=2768166 RepID=UPI0028DE41A6|nr:hypothetical protein [Clostridium sp. 19966]MDT8718306.1 hypothetical protein [Clostridium sp. 19966]